MVSHDSCLREVARTLFKGSIGRTLGDRVTSVLRSPVLQPPGYFHTTKWFALTTFLPTLSRLFILQLHGMLGHLNHDSCSVPVLGKGWTGASGGWHTSCVHADCMPTTFATSR